MFLFVEIYNKYRTAPATKNNAPTTKKGKAGKPQVKFGFSYQRKIFSLLWASVDVGYRKNIGFDFNRYFSDHNRDTIVSSDIPGGMYAGITLFITPPTFGKN